MPVKELLEMLPTTDCVLAAETLFKLANEGQDNYIIKD